MPATLSEAIHLLHTDPAASVPGDLQLRAGAAVTTLLPVGIVVRVTERTRGGFPVRSYEAEIARHRAGLYEVAPRFADRNVWAFPGEVEAIEEEGS